MHLTEPDMEQMEPSGVENFCLQIIMDLNGWAALNHFWQIGGDISAKEGWRIAVSLIYQQTQDKEQTMEIVKKLNLCSEPECKGDP